MSRNMGFFCMVGTLIGHPIRVKTANLLAIQFNVSGQCLSLSLIIGFKFFHEISDSTNVEGGIDA